MSARWLRFAFFALVLFVGSTRAQEAAAAAKLLLTGHYEDAAEQAEKAIAKNEREEEWRLVLIKAQLALGRYPQALNVATNALRRYAYSLRTKLLAHQVFQATGRAAEAGELLESLNELGGNNNWRYRDAEAVVALGEAAVLLGADPKLVLDNFFEPAKKSNPKLRDIYIAAGSLALDKQDFALAAKYFNEGLKQVGAEDPALHFGLARAFAPDNRQEMIKSLQAALDKNPRHTGALLLFVDHLIDAEAYDDAEEKLKLIEAVNPNLPEMWAYRAVIANVHFKTDAAKKAQEKALEYNAKNPRVAHLIGLKLSQKYRFTEGSEFQRQALAWDSKFQPAKFQLAQDMLRLGEEGEGWALAEAVHNADAYNVGAYNLVTLKDTLTKFETFTNEHFIVRMTGAERSIYGDDVLALLDRAYQSIVAKYHSQLAGPTTVEIFPEQKDFAIRTFGMPGGEGYLGVCFGRVITANSPASQAAHPSNWQAMLWHEFCHVVTLQLTRNRMPRWLSEGISVYEERVANPTWGQTINPRYREMILNGELKAIGELSSAFMSATDDIHLQFAYYQSYLVVEFIVQKFGHAALETILRDLAEGVLINDAIAKHTTKLSDLDKDFNAHAKAVAEDLAPKLDWSKPKYQGNGTLDLTWAVAHPNNYFVLDDQATDLMELKKWAEAKVPLLKILAEYPSQIGPNSAARKLATVHRELGEKDQETALLRKLAARDGEAIDVYVRLMEADSKTDNWQETLENAERARAVNPLLLAPNQRRFTALQKLDRPKDAIVAGEKVLRLNPPDPTTIHFEMANLMAEGDVEAARLHTLQALEEAPRFREAQKLLLKFPKSKSEPPNSSPLAPARDGKFE